MYTDDNVPMEDKEQYFMDRERRLEAQAEHREVERIIDTREGDDGTEYFVKWKGIEYKECTWEPAELLVGKELNAQEEIDR